MTKNNAVIGARADFNVLPMSSEHGHGVGQGHRLDGFIAKGSNGNGNGNGSDKNRDDDEDEDADFEAAMRSGGMLNLSSAFTIHHPEDEDDD